MKDRTHTEQRIAEILRSVPAEKTVPEFDQEWVANPNRVILDPLTLRRLSRQRGRYNVIAASAAAVLFALFSIGIYLYTGNSENGRDRDSLRGVVVSLSGASSLIRDGSTEAITSGKIVMSGDTIRSGANGTVDVVFPGGVLFRLKPNGRLTLTRLSLRDESGKEIRLALDSGTLLNHIDRLSSGEEFSVATPTAIAGVRGTAFEIGADESGTRIHLIEGSLAVRSVEAAEERQVRDGSSITIEDGRVDVVSTPAPPEIVAEVENLKKIRSFGDEKSIQMVSNIEVLRTEEEIKRKYAREMEELRFRNGRTLRGVTVYQNAGGIIFQSVDGVHFVRTEDLIDINYADIDFAGEKGDETR